MFNDRSSLEAFFATRRSGKPRDMVAPGPDDAQLRRILSAAMRVPDHGKLAPWRFVVVAPEQRDAFAALLGRAYRETRAEPGRQELASIEEFARQDGTTINQFIVSAVAEKLSALTAAEFFAQRRADGDIDWALAFLSREGGEAPAADDRLPAKYHGKPGA